ncbi:MAG: BhlA/UviB family holin-like peptide, partial [Firmicutes bacterium]|nr:BhlA/UviB family holin-like peptide [Bacillota bacterium]
MWEQVLETAASSGLWCMLFVGLFVYQIKDGRAREAKYQDTIAGLAEKLKIVQGIKDTLSRVAEHLKIES